MNCCRETSLVLTPGSTEIEDALAFILIWLLAAAMEHSPTGMGDQAGPRLQGPCSPRAAAAPGGHVSFTDRASAWCDLGQCPAPAKLGRPRPPLCTGTVFSVHGAHLLAGISSYPSPLHLGAPVSLRGKQPRASELLSHHWALRAALPREAGLVPCRASGMSGRGHGGWQLWPPVPGPPALCPAGQLCSSLWK